MHIKVEVIVGLALAILIIAMSGTAMAVCIDGYKIDNCSGLGLEGWPISISNETAGYDTVTGPNGYYQVCGLTPGNYVVAETQDPDWMNLTPYFVDVTLGASNLTVNFTNQRLFGNISVTKYNDLNGNGQRDPGEPGLNNWRINLSYAPNGTLYQSNLTDTNGDYLFTHVPWGEYHITEVTKNGWTQTEPVTDYYNLIVNCTSLDTTFLFGNHQNKIFGYKTDNQTSQGIPNWTINLYNNANGILLDNTTTNSSGYYEFSGAYIRPNRVYLMNETPQPGYVLISPISGQYIVLPLNGSHLDEGPLNFTNQQQFCIDGYKINHCTGEGLEGWNVTLDDESGVIGTAITNTSGYYRFCGLTPGFYTVCEELQPGWTNLTPFCMEVEILDADITNINFTNTGMFCIDGYKLDEGTGDGLGNWNITIMDESGAVVGEAVTDPDGYYQVCNLIPGTYTVCEDLKEGWVNVTLICVEVNMPCNNLTVNFTNKQIFCIDGYKIDNCTGAGLEGWNVTLDDESGAIGTAITNASGYYQFCGLTPGLYTVCEELQPGWTNLTPICVDVEVTRSDVTGINFTNTGMFCIDGYKRDEGTGEGLGDWNITLMDGSGAVVGKAVTDPDGYYQVCNLIPGTYTVIEELQDGWVNVTPFFVEVTLECTNLTVNFTNKQIFCIDGYKLDNCTGAGLEGWNITLDDGSGVIGTAITNASGYYQFCGLTPGLYTVCEELQPGWTNLTPICVDIEVTHADVTGINFTNTGMFCIDGYKRDEGTGEGLGDWNITLMDESGAVVGEAVTDPDGYYQVCNLIPGTYMVIEELQDGWVNVTPLFVEVTLECTNLTVNFSNQELFCIDGYKIDTCSGEGLEGWNVTLDDESGVIGTAITNASGYYQFCSLTPGLYTVCEELQPGWTNLTPICVDVELTGADVSGINFTNTGMFCIDGYKRDEGTGDGLGDWNITLMDESGAVVGKAVTDPDGYYQVCNLIPGTYTVIEELQDGWVNVTPLFVEVTLECTNLTVNFSNQELFCIDGYKIDNCTGAGLEGWNVTLDDESGVIGTAITNASGYYQFCGLTPGLYTVCEELQPGWTNLTPICMDVEVTGADVSGINFTNTRELCIDGYKFDAFTGTGLAGWTITVEDEAGGVVTATTGMNGYFKVCGLFPGNYRVCEELQPGWTNLTPACVNVMLACKNQTVLFINDPVFCIDGYKIDDSSGEGLEGWTINVEDEYGEPVGSVITNVSGYYQICNLIPGNYTVCEEMQPGWINLTPLCVDVEVTDADVTGINFTNNRLDGSIIGWAASHCNVGSLRVPGIKVCVALSPEDLAAGNGWCNITDIRGIYTITDLPVGVPLYAMATAPGYEQRPILYQIDGGKVVICENVSCNPVIPPLVPNNTTQVNWFPVRDPAFFP